MLPTNEEIDDVLDRLQRTRMEIVDDDPQWQSDAAKQGLPVVNVHDTHGAKVLNTDAIIRGSYPNHARRK